MVKLLFLITFSSLTAVAQITRTKNELKFITFQEQKMPKYGDMSCQWIQLVNKGIRQSCHNSGVSYLINANCLIPRSITNSNLLSFKKSSNSNSLEYLPFYQPKPYFLNEDIMKLPAANTNDIIKILDRDRLLTQW